MPERGAVRLTIKLEAHAHRSETKACCLYFISENYIYHEQNNLCGYESGEAGDDAQYDLQLSFVARSRPFL